MKLENVRTKLRSKQNPWSNFSFNPYGRLPYSTPISKYNHTGTPANSQKEKKNIL